MLVIEWYMTRFVVKNMNQKDICYYEIELCAQNISTIVASLINTNEKTCVNTFYLIN